VATDTATKPVNPFENITPVFGAKLREPKKPQRPSDGAIAMAQRSFMGHTPEGTEEIQHAMTHRFATEEMADFAEDELKRAGAYTDPQTTVQTVRDPENTGDKRIVRWQAGLKRGRK